MNRDFISLGAWLAAMVIGGLMWWGLIKVILYFFFPR